MALFAASNALLDNLHINKQQISDYRFLCMPTLITHINNLSEGSSF